MGIAGRVLLGLWVVVALGACATRIGARAMPAVRFDYNEAVAVSGNEQILLNLVRMRFNHTVQFLEPTNVVTSWSITRNGGVGGSASSSIEGPLTLAGNLSAGVSATETPTVTYQPLSGERFVQLMAKPIGPELLLSLIQSGWAADLVLQLTAERINDLTAPPLPTADRQGQFEAALEQLTKLQRAQQLAVELGPDGAYLGFRTESSQDALVELLGMQPETDRLRVTTRRFDRGPDEIALHTRSLLSTLFYASYGVEVSVDDPTAPPLGVDTPLDPPHLRVRSGASAPGPEAYVRVRYRGRWYWIDDADLPSKRTFSLLSLLFSLMAAPDAAVGPMLTVPAGG